MENKEKTPITTQALLNALGWTEENHPTRESLEDIPEWPEKPKNRYASGKSREYSPEFLEYEISLNKRYDALARLDIWDAAFGPKTNHFVGFEDPEVQQKAREKQAHFDATITPMPTSLQQLAALKVSKVEPTVTKKLSEFFRDSLNQNREPDEDDTSDYLIIPVSHFFDTNPKNENAMKQLRSANCKHNIMQYQDGYIPVSYLCVTYKTERFLDAVENLSQDLKLLADKECIVGNLSLPKILQLKHLQKYSLYCWPFIDYEKLAKSVGKNFSEDFACDHNELLKFVGIKTATYEGCIGVELESINGESTA